MDSAIIGGVKVLSGPRTVELDTPALIPEGIVKRAVFPLVTTAGSASLYAAPSTSDESLLVIPAYSMIKDAWIYVHTAFTSTTNATGIDVGLVKASDLTTEIDFNGIIPVGSEGAKAALTAHSWQKAANGSLLGKSIGADDAALYAKWAAATDTLTGKAVVVVEWIEKLDRVLGV